MVAEIFGVLLVAARFARLRRQVYSACLPGGRSAEGLSIAISIAILRALAGIL